MSHFEDTSSSSSDDATNDSYDDSSYSQASHSQGSWSWQVQPQLDFPALFPYHTGFNSVHAGATTTINTPSVAPTNANGKVERNPRLHALGIQDLLQELHHKHLIKRKRPPQRLLASMPPPISDPEKRHKKSSDLKRLQNELSLRWVNHFAGGGVATETELETARCQGKLAKLALELGELPTARSALEARQKVLKLVHGPHCKEAAVVGIALGGVLNNLGDWFEANHSYREALASKSLEEAERGVCFIGIGRALLNSHWHQEDDNDNHNNTKQAKEALDCLTKGHKILMRHDKKKVDGEVLRLMAIAETESGGPTDEALARLKVSRQIFRGQHDYPGLLQTMMATASTYGERGEDNLARTCLADCRKIAKTKLEGSLQQRALARTHIAEGDLYASQREFLRSTESYQEALDVCKSLGENGKEEIEEALAALGDLHCLQEQADSALSVLQRVDTPDTSLMQRNAPEWDQIDEVLVSLGDVNCQVKKGIVSLKPPSEDNETSDTSPLHRHVLFKRGILYFQCGEYSSACLDLSAFCLGGQNDKDEVEKTEAYRVALFTQGVCEYLVGGNNSKAKKLCKEALRGSRTTKPVFDADVHKALKKSISKMKTGMSFGKVLAKFRGHTSRVSRSIELGSVAE